MKLNVLIQFLLLITTIYHTLLSAQSASNTYYQFHALMAPPASFQEGLLGFVNPANLKYVKGIEGRFYWTSGDPNFLSIEDWGLVSSVNFMGFGVSQQKNSAGKRLREYRLYTAFGREYLSFGIGYGWRRQTSSENLLIGGAIFRPIEYLSLGFVGNFALNNNTNLGMAEIGIRPFGNSRLTIFADGAIQNREKISDAPWSIGGAIKVTNGIFFTGRIFENQSFNVGISINLGRLGMKNQLHFDDKNKHSFNSSMIRLGRMKSSIINTLIQRERRYYRRHLKGKVTHLKYTLFDENKQRLFDILQDIEAAQQDPRVALIAFNISDLKVLPAHGWEIRKALHEFKKSGKKVLIFLDFAGMSNYHLASIADLVIMDPYGYILLPGYLTGRTYFKGTLEKLGLGFDEWRLYKYKSTAEILSRKDMSEADREQSESYIDDLYETVREEICKDRNFSESRFDELVNKEILFHAEKAQKTGLVDTLARWSDLDDIIRQHMHKKLWSISSNNLYVHAIGSQRWGPKPQIAVVYGVGETELESGIRARWLSEVFLKLKKKKSVKAVVFRVDSPGGDPLASDLVAKTMKECANQKPVIVSQGQVAASGGYHISTYGNKIVATPATVTGSIGVIGGWIYDRNFSKQLGITSDFVKRGDHADFRFGPGLWGLRIPARNLSEFEKEKVISVIEAYYDKFINKVAQGRSMTVTEVRRIAEGQIYSGIRGETNGLVDQIGNFTDAISLAKNMAGIDKESELEILEIPENKGLINLQAFFRPQIPGIHQTDLYQYLKHFSRHPFLPLPLLLPGTYPAFESYFSWEHYPTPDHIIDN